VYTVLVANGLLREELSPGSYEFYATGDEEEFRALAPRFLGPIVAGVKRHPLR
jgi:hypothetical protein